MMMMSEVFLSLSLFFFYFVSNFSLTFLTFTSCHAAVTAISEWCVWMAAMAMVVAVAAVTALISSSCARSCYELSGKICT